MARGFYSYEIGDQDLDWLISNFLCEHPEFMPIESGHLPIVLLAQNEEMLEFPDEADVCFNEEEMDLEEIA